LRHAPRTEIARLLDGPALAANRGGVRAAFDVASARPPLLPDFWLGFTEGDRYDAGSWTGRSRLSENRQDFPDDIALLEAVAAADLRAFQQLYDRHASALFALALKILGNRADAEDVLQEAFVQVWKTAGSFHSARGKPISWLILLTRSRAIDRLRSRRTRDRVTETAAHQPADDAPPASQQAVASETQTLVRRAVESLDAEQRRLIELAYFGGLTQSEIAAQLGQPLGTVKTRIRAGMMRLRELLEAQP
jgi:RNA polymerase sigma-70 factor (ECF subfamily)